MRSMSSGAQQAQAFTNNASVELAHRVIIEAGNNSYNDDQEVTASSVKLVRNGFNPYGDLIFVSNGGLTGGNVKDTDPVISNTSRFWRADDVFNNKNRSTMKWLVCDAGAVVHDVADGNGFRAISTTEGDYEKGWWSYTKSDGSGNFSSPEYVQSIWGPARQLTTISLYTTEGYSNMKNVTVSYYGVDDSWHTVANVTLGPTEYQHDFTVNVSARGLRVQVHSTYRAGDWARISELNGTYVIDISDHVVSIDMSDTREEYQSTVPIGTTLSNSCSITLDNTDGLFNLIENPYFGKDNKLSVELGVVVSGTPEYIKMGDFWADQWSNSSSSMEATVSCRDASRFLQDNTIPWGKVWTNTTFEAPLRELLQLNGIDSSHISIDPTGLHTFQILFSKENEPWNFIGEVALADQAYFGFDNNNIFRYQSYSQLNTVSPDAILSDSTNIIDGSIDTQIYANKITVKLSQYNLDNIELSAVWSAPETRLTYGILAGGIDATQTNELTLGYGQFQHEGLGGYFTWPAKNGLIFLPTVTTTVFLDGTVNTVTAGELIKYKNRTGSVFTNLTRGYLGTTATSHSAGAYAGEARLFNMEFSNAPVLSMSYPYITAIDELLIEPSERRAQAFVVLFDYDAFKGRLCVANMVEFITYLSGTGESLVNYLDQAHTVDQSWGCAVPGRVAVDSGAENVKDTIDNPSATINDLIRRYGKNEIEISNNWIQTTEHAQSIVDFYIREFKNPRRIITLSATADLRFQSGDLVRITTLDSLGITNLDAHIISINYTYDGGLKMDLTVREIA